MKSLLAVQHIVVTLLLSPNAAMADARIPIFKPTTIDQPGHYVVTRDIVVLVGPLLTIGTDGVTVDLNGHTLEVQDPGNSVVVLNATAGVTTGVTIRGGRIVGGRRGVRGWASNPRHVRLERLEIANSNGHAIRFDNVASIEITDCVVVNSGGSGIFLDGAGVPFRARLVRNVIQNAGIHGIHAIELSGGEILWNSVVDHQDVGIRLMGTVSTGGNLLTGNRVRGSVTGQGISIDAAVSDNQLMHNVVTDNADDGIALFSDGNRLVANQVSGGGDHGLHVEGSYNLIEDNQIVENAGYGLFFTGIGVDNVYRGNMLRGNISGEISGTADDAGDNILDLP